MKVAIVHYWLVGMRGGEKVLESLCRLYPQADIFTHAFKPEAISELIRSHTVRTTFIASLPRSARLYKAYLPLMPMALEQLDLRGYDLVISSEAGPAKGVIAPPEALHICYCHSPMRYIWNMYHDYRERRGALTRAIMVPFGHYLRMWDQASAARVDYFVANSRNVARRIEKTYRRDAAIIHPPVDTEVFRPNPDHKTDEFYLMVGELVPYKRTELAIEAFNRTGERLVVIGGGEMLPKLRAMAAPNVELLGPQPIEVLRAHYSQCKALIFPGEEDFGIVPLEAMASGRPVIAYGRGGATETVIPGETGLFFGEQTPDAIIAALEVAQTMVFDPAAISAHAQSFGVRRFETEMKTFIDRALARNHCPDEWTPLARDHPQALSAKRVLRNTRNDGWPSGSNGAAREVMPSP